MLYMAKNKKLAVSCCLYSAECIPIRELFLSTVSWTVGTPESGGEV